ncbi:MAG: preprotein translocase subunit YajC [Actinobacteria bacterium]|nr:preprotein translocase subunit YajC [Actinomycetota bacterium]
MNFLFIIILFVIAWVVLILPKQRELKRHNALIESLTVGDEVMSGSGLYGTLVEIDGDTVLLQVAPHVEIKLARRAIAARVVEPTTADSDSPVVSGGEESSEGTQS